MQANVYPYTRGNNNLVEHHPALGPRGRHRQPARAAEGPGAARPAEDATSATGIPGWYNHYTAVGGDWSRMLVSGKLSPSQPAFQGLTMDRILAAKSAGTSPRPTRSTCCSTS